MHVTLYEDRTSAVSLLAAAAIFPLVISVGLAVDYSFYVEARSELSLAADTASMEAVRTAAANFAANGDAAGAGVLGATAGQQWFNAQLATLRTGKVQSVVVPPVQYNASTSTFSATVSYTGTVPTHFGGLLAISQWGMTGSSTSVITTNSYAEVVMLIDNSSSMLIGATPADILALDNATMCAPTATAVAAKQTMSAYSYYYNGANFGYGYNQNGSTYTDQIIPTQANAAAAGGQCNPSFDGGAQYCPYPPNSPTQQNPTLDSGGFCPPGQGIPDSPPVSNPILLPRIDPVTHVVGNIPQAPCSFACHTGDGVHDYYTIARNIGVSLRFDVIQAAAAVVVQQMQQQEQIPNQFSLGVFQFNSGVTQVFPDAATPVVEAGNDLNRGATKITGITTPIVADAANTNFPGAIQYLAANLQPAGDGNTPTTPRKNIFIVTDGLEDYPPSDPPRLVGQMTNPTNETYCSQLKSLGFNVFVLYTPYYPLPNNFYLQRAKSSVEPTVPPAATNPVVAALQACATTPQQFYQASSPADIQAAMLAMLQSALNSPARIAS